LKILKIEGTVGGQKIKTFPGNPPKILKTGGSLEGIKKLSGKGVSKTFLKEGVSKNSNFLDGGASKNFLEGGHFLDGGHQKLF
jgi:hypothetical protein